jgi:hypothetical protein
MSKKMMPLQGYRKIAEDDHTVTLRHEKGHVVQMALRALSHQDRSVLRSMKMAPGGSVGNTGGGPKGDGDGVADRSIAKMAEGGDPTLGTVYRNAIPVKMAAGGELGTVWPDYVCRNPNCKSYGKSHPNCRCGPATANPGGSLKAIEAFARTGNPNAGKGPKPGPGTIPMLAKGGEIEHYCSGGKSHKKGCEYFKDGGEEDQDQESENLPDLPEEESGSNRSPASTLVSNPQEQQDPVQMGQQGAIQAMTSAQRALSRQSGEQAGINQKLDAQVQDKLNQVEDMSTPQELFEDFQSKNQKLQDEIKAQHIDPNRIWHQASAAGKIAGAIGIMLGGIGGKGQGNAGLDVINATAQRDMEAQKADLGNLHTLYSMNLEGYKNEAAATAATQAQLLGAAKAQIDQAAANTNNLQARTNSQVASADIAQKIAQLNMQATIYKKLSDTDSPQEQIQNKMSGSPVNLNKLNLLSVASKQGIPGAPGAEEMSHIANETKTIETARALRSSYIDSFNKLNKMHLAGTFSPQQRDAYVTELAAKLGQATGATEAMTHAEANAMFPDAKDIGNKTRQVKLRKGLQLFENMEAPTPTVRRFGAYNPAPEVQMKHGNIYQRGPKGWMKTR